jgi:aspartate carbamoyltransferase regulatory subunit
VKIDSIQDGIVLDHIQAGKGMEIYRLLHLDDLDCTVAIIKNVKSRTLGRKDIIKIDETIDLDLDILGFIDKDITVNTIRGGKLWKKQRGVPLPARLVNIIPCKNPRCITASEPSIDHLFRLVSEDPPLYRCAYCETAAR